MEECEAIPPGSVKELGGVGWRRSNGGEIDLDDGFGGCRVFALGRGFGPLVLAAGRRLLGSAGCIVRSRHGFAGVMDPVWRPIDLVRRRRVFVPALLLAVGGYDPDRSQEDDDEKEDDDEEYDMRFPKRRLRGFPVRCFG